MKRNQFPAGWNEARLRKVLAHYEGQTEEEAVAEDEEVQGRTLARIGFSLLPL